MKNNLYLNNSLWDKINIEIKVETYANNDQIAILLYEKDSWEYYGDLSVFVEPFEDKSYMALDTNNTPDAEWFVERYKLWTLVSYVHSGFCSYPVYAMDLEELMKYDSFWVSKFILNK